MRGRLGQLRPLALLAIAVLAMLVLARPAPAQQAAPHVGYVYPAGGKQGTTFQVNLGGQRLEGVHAAVVSGSGIRAKVLEFTKPLTQVQFQLLRDQVKELLDKKASAAPPAVPATGPAVRPATASRPATQATTKPTTRPVWTAEDEKKLAEVRKKLLNPPRRNQNQSIAQTVTLQVTIDVSAEPGPRELRLLTPAGLTNPIAFVVGQLPEVTPKDLPLSMGVPGSLRGARDVTLPATINGQIMPGAVDRYRFKARQGQHLVAAVSARALMPYISDAVPGWFQAAITLYDANNGREVAFADHDRHQPDPVVHYLVPADGEYILEIRDSIYRGREDFIYRIALGELPWITGIFPRGGKAGAATTVELAGWNLPSASTTFDGRNRKPGVYSLAVSRGGVSSNAVPFALDDLPEVTEREPNDKVESAQLVSLPVMLNGRIGKPGDVDVFRFQATGGDELVAEVMARRLDSPLDSVLTLTDASGKPIASNDDHEDKGAGLNTHHADSYLRVRVPASGEYGLHIADLQGKGGPDYGYRLRIGTARPDFALRVVPASLSARGGASVPVTVYALRRDGFAGEITLALRGVSGGFTLAGGKLPAGQDQVKLTLKAPPTHLDEPVALAIEGRATIGGQSVSHLAVPAEDMMQAFLYRHLVPAQDLLAAVNAAPIARANMKILSPTPVKLTPGQNARIEVAMPTTTFLGKVDLELADPPEGVSLLRVAANREGTQIVLACDAAKAKPGAKGNLIFTAVVDRPAGAGNAPAPKRRVPMGTLPAIPFEIVGR